MGTIIAEVVGPRRDARGRQRFTRAQKEQFIAHYEQSGLTQRAFAEREGLGFSSFTSWLRKKTATGRPRFAELSLPKVSTLEVQLPDGTVLRGGRAVELAELLRELKRC
jgi:transposase-like protein